MVIPRLPLRRGRRRSGLRRGGLAGQDRARPVHAQRGEGGELLRRELPLEDVVSSVARRVA
ncbi:hypothetical protein [Streptomyces prunicolor]|uniref:Uncharacterized protein n=1 Tax=Streptomyces prunicolor TaxID=67348 RepID=A0ABU4FIH5_9ACTN|nr:hypothetical protein [Streptomyces prunicolor]MDV7220408.1 hypothetical protein [Streptomyces prunicolor]